MFFSYSPNLLFDLGSEDGVTVATGERTTCVTTRLPSPAPAVQ
jgi:hypothetical protein